MLLSVLKGRNIPFRRSRSRVNLCPDVDGWTLASILNDINVAFWERSSVSHPSRDVEHSYFCPGVAEAVMRFEMSSCALMTSQRFAITANAQRAGAASIDCSPAEGAVS